MILIGLTVRYADLEIKITSIKESRSRARDGINKGKAWIVFFMIFIFAFIYIIYNANPFLTDNIFITRHTAVCLFLATLNLFSIWLFKKSDHLDLQKLGGNQFSLKAIKERVQGSSFRISCKKQSVGLGFVDYVSNKINDTLRKLPQFKPEAILFIKAISFLIIAFQLIVPLLSQIVQSFDFEQFILIKNIITPQAGIYDNGQYHWIIIVTILLFSIYCIEYEWIIRPRIVAREDNALSPGARPKWSDYSKDEDPKNIPPDHRTRSRKYNLELERNSLPFLTYSAWMPTLITTINLGFDSLDQKSVIQAMLVGLRQKYYTTFLSWSSIRANIRRFISLNLILIAVLIMSNVFFNIPNNKSIKNDLISKLKKIENSEKSVATTGSTKIFSLTIVEKYALNEHKNDYCKFIDILDDNNITFPPISVLLCKLNKDVGNIALPILYFELLPINVAKEENVNKLLFWVLHLNYSFPDKLKIDEENIHKLSLRIFHVLLFLLTIGAFRWINFKSPFLSHKRNIQQIDDLLDSLTGKVSRIKSRELSKPAQWVQSIFIDAETHSVEKEKSDQRTIELAFLSILNDIRRTSNVFPLAFSKKRHTQAIEITFVFDELDKLSVHADHRNEASEAASSNNDYQAEKNRIDDMQRLLSDMKRILSSAPARFIFVGGRLLYDQWLADGTKKQPLLSSIFNGQLNLKSLLVHQDNHWDVSSKDNKNIGLSNLTTFHSRIEEYLYLQHFYSKMRYEEWVRKQWVPFIGLHDDPQVEMDFSQWRYNITKVKYHKEIKFFSCDPSSIRSNLSTFYVESLINFLTYRSAGNPKKLKELFASFIQPTSRVIGDKTLREDNFPDQDVLVLNSLTTLKIQLISSIYEHLRSGFELKLVTRDDKIVEALFYLTDFLFKFHSRAFSWDSLERIDELDHVHRPPDVHRILEQLVDHSSEKFLHKVLNGMYSFRFRSDITKEIEFLSRNSPEEMAAFNFTLDESQTLKQSYKRALGASDNINSDLVAGLGALYEYDQDFEAARYNYKHAIKILDDQLENITGSEVSLSLGANNHIKTSPLKAIYSGKLDGQKNVTLDLSWGGTRLRIMLKIGLTFERSKNYERAILQYRECLNLSNALVDAYIIKPEKNSLYSNSIDTSKLDGEPCEHNQVLKHLNIIFQSVFANAWAAEKLIGGIDSSTSIVEKELWTLRNRLPFVNESGITNSIDTAQKFTPIGHAYFSVIMSQLHNKAGDLYFFKGAQNSEYKGLDNTGYLLRSHYHYAISLHEMRRYIFYRKHKSGNKWGSFHHQTTGTSDASSFIAEGCWPDFQTLGVSDGLSDLSESTLALVSVKKLYSSFKDSIFLTKFTNNHKEKISENIIKWFEMCDDDASKNTYGVQKNFRMKLKFCDWFGTWKNFSVGFTSSEPKRVPSIGKIISFNGENSIEDRFLMSLYLSIASADLIEKTGYLENSAREYLQICDTISQYFWWFYSLDKLDEKEIGPKMSNYLYYCLSIAVWILGRLDKLYILSKKTPVNDKYIIGKVIPPSAITLACSLSIISKVLCNGSQNKELLTQLTGLIEKWRGEKFKEDETLGFQKILENSICIHKYPILNQLNTLKLLIDSNILTSNGSSKDTIKWMEELHELNSRYHSPLHFTPNMIGITYANFYLYKNEDIGKLSFDLEAELLRSFRESKEMFTMGRSYYTSIDNLYYLYDDFNDRLIHRNHAMQMACAGLVRRYEEEIRKK